MGERELTEAQDARMAISTMLVEFGADPDNRQHGCGGTPLHHTLAGGYIELVKYLLEAKADVNANNRYGACLFFFLRARAAHAARARARAAPPRRAHARSAC